MYKKCFICNNELEKRKLSNVGNLANPYNKLPKLSNEEYLICNNCGYKEIAVQEQAD